MASGTKVHPDWGSSYGIPWIVVGPTEPKVPVTFDYADESDPGPYPIPGTAPVEGGPGADPGSDRHILALQTGDCLLWEM